MSKQHKDLLKLFEKRDFPSDFSSSFSNFLSGRKLIIYGAGQGFVTFSLFVLKKYNVIPSLIIDKKFKRGEVFNGIPAISPNDYIPSDDDREGIVVITTGKQMFLSEIMAYLKSSGFKNIVHANDIYEYHLPHPPEALKRGGFSYYYLAKWKIMKVFNLLEDETSRDIFYSVIRTHMERKIFPIPSRPLEEQYFPEDIPISKGYSRFINCGAYTGDTVVNLNSKKGKIDSLVCFEPDQDNFQILVNYLFRNKDVISKEIILFPCGLWNKTVQLRFEGGNCSNSLISEEGEKIIQCVDMDSVLPSFQATFISMDVEGAELEALQGGEKLIRENFPDLAICVYHVPHHIWEIPIYLSTLSSRYKFYLRNYTGFIAETVLYAVT